MEQKSLFKENFKMLRTQQGLTQKQLADLMRISYKTVSHWETGYTEPSIAQLIAIADFFHLSSDELVGREEK